MDPKRVGHAGLVGWREKVGDRVARFFARRTAAEEDTLRALLGLAFLVISIRTTVKMIRGVVDGVRKER